MSERESGRGREGGREGEREREREKAALRRATNTLKGSSYTSEPTSKRLYVSYTAMYNE